MTMNRFLSTGDECAQILSHALFTQVTGTLANYAFLECFCAHRFTRIEYASRSSLINNFVNNKWLNIIGFIEIRPF